MAAGGFSDNSGGVTINGTASQFVVININNGTSNENFQGPLLLSGGITPDHVLWNFTGTSGNLGGTTNGAAVTGIFLAPNMAFNADNITFEGRLFGGAPNADFETVSGFTLVQAGVPEPSTTALGLVTAVFGLGYARYRRKNATPAA